MVSVNVHSHYCVVELRVGTLQDLIVLMLFVIKRVQATEKEIKDTC
jgi:hypothetical protein